MQDNIASNTDNSNTINLTDPNYALIAAQYRGSPAAFKCPSDKGGLNNVPRVRSYSMNGAMGEGRDTSETKAYFMRYPNGGQTYTKLTNIKNPSDKFVMLDEKSDLINDGALYVDCSATGDMLWDVPGNYHNNATAFNFADGHSEVHKWKGIRVSGATAHDTHVPVTDLDMQWLKEHAW